MCYDILIHDMKKVRIIREKISWYVKILLLDFYISQTQPIRGSFQFRKQCSKLWQLIVLLNILSSL